MKLLAIDTSTDACSAALWLDGEVRQCYQVAPREHGQLILPMIESLLAEAELTLVQMDALSFGRGPGGFTGVRIANGVIQGLAFGADLPVVPVSSLAALAQGTYVEGYVPVASGVPPLATLVRRAGCPSAVSAGMRKNRRPCTSRVLAAIDARIGEVYWGAYRAAENGLMVLVDHEIVCPPQHVPLPDHDLDHDWFGAGSGWLMYAQQLKTRLGDAVAAWDGQRYPQAQHIAQLGVDAFQRGLAVSAEQALPVYLRDEVAWKKSG